MNLNELISKEFDESLNVLKAFISDSHNLSLIENAANTMAKSLRQGGRIFSCGNGGSHCDAMHFAEELTGRYRLDRKPYAAIAISDASHITCVGNDFGFDEIFVRYLMAHARPGDVLLAISTSGNSNNVCKAAQWAKDNGAHVVSLTGNSGGKLAGLSDIEIRVPHLGYADRIQEIHIKIIHSLILSIEKLME